MYSIILNDGRIINIKAENIEFHTDTRTISFKEDRKTIAEVNMNNIVGYSRWTNVVVEK